MNAIGVFFIVSLFFSPLAAACSFLITYEEYRKHLKPKQAIRHAFETAVFTCIAFMIVGLVAGFLFRNGIQ